MSIQIVTDSTAYLDRAFVQKHAIKVVPLSYYFEGEVYAEGFPGEFDSVYEKLRNGAALPKSSQPSIAAFLQTFEQALAQKKEVIAILISSFVSGTYNCACAAARMLGSPHIHVIDSRFGACAARFMVENMLSRIHEGLVNAEELVDACKEDIKRITFELAAEKLEYLQKSGRLSAAAAHVGTLLNICPVIELRNGVLEAREKVRGQKRAIEAMISRIPHNARRIGIVHALNRPLGEQLLKRLELLFPQAAVSLEEVGPCVGANIGPGTVGICCERAPEPVL